MIVPDVPVGDARDREQAVLRYDTSHIQICRSVRISGSVPLRPGALAGPHQNGQSVRVTSTQRGNVELIRRALDSDPDALAGNIVWHFQSPHPELVTHFEGKDKVLKDWPRMLDDLTHGTFKKRAVDFWPVGEDLVVAHFEVEMTIGDVRHQGSSVVVYRLSDGVIVEGFDIPSLSLLIGTD